MKKDKKKGLSPKKLCTFAPIYSQLTSLAASTNKAILDKARL